MSATAGILAGLRARRDRRKIEGLRRFGIESRHEQLGIGTPELRRLARRHRRDHALARELWASGVFEAMILATLVEDPRQITRAQADRWVRDCDNWAQTDALAFLLDRTPFAADKARAWSKRRAEFAKHTGFALMAGTAPRPRKLARVRFAPATGGRSL